MKKKIILFLSFLIMAVSLTGCSANEIEGEEYETMTEIASSIANEKGYILPEGYTVSYADKTTNARIKITKQEKTKKIEFTFDISQDEIKLINSNNFHFVNFIFEILVIPFTAFIGFIVGYYKKPRKQ